MRPGTVATPTPTIAVPSCQVTVLEAAPAEPFDVVALLEVSRGPLENEENALDAARLKACALGGDAIVVTYRRERRSGFETRRPPPGVFPDPALRVAVIRYRDR